MSPDPVSKYVFGSFIEHIGNLIYRSMWAEMLDDRKFYFPIVSKDPESPARPQGNPMRMQLRKWRPVGPDDAKAMAPRISANDRQKLDQFFTAVRETEQRLVKTESWSQTPKPKTMVNTVASATAV